MYNNFYIVLFYGSAYFPLTSLEKSNSHRSVASLYHIIFVAYKCAMKQSPRRLIKSAGDTPHRHLNRTQHKSHGANPAAEPARHSDQLINQNR